MAQFDIQPPPHVALPISGKKTMFPVRRVYCIGRNYAAHAIEMGHDPDREPPFFFQKNPNNLDTSGDFPYPPKTSDVHHEIEMAVMLKSGGKNIPIDSALDSIYGYALSLDMTRRDLQGEQKKAGRPWEIGKAFEHSAPIGAVHLVEEVGHLSEGRVELQVNGEVRQEGDLNQMIWILSGTPAGVGPVEKGDVMQVSVTGLGSMTVKVT